MDFLGLVQTMNTACCLHLGSNIEARLKEVHPVGGGERHADSGDGIGTPRQRRRLTPGYPFGTHG